MLDFDELSPKAQAVFLVGALVYALRHDTATCGDVSRTTGKTAAEALDLAESFIAEFDRRQRKNA